MSELPSYAVQQIIADMREAFGNAAMEIAQGARCVMDYYTSPSVLYRPCLSPDGNQWCALYGKNLQEGVAGFGDSPADAMRDFDKNWLMVLKP